MMKDRKRICLAKGWQNDPYVWAAAMRRFWEITGTSLGEKVQAVDWSRLAAFQWSEAPNETFATAYPKAEHEHSNSQTWLHQVWMIGRRTEEQLRSALDVVGVSDDMMSRFVPHPPFVEEPLASNRQPELSSPDALTPPPPFPLVLGDDAERVIEQWIQSWPDFRRLGRRRGLAGRRLAQAFVTHGLPAAGFVAAFRQVWEMSPSELTAVIQDESRFRNIVAESPDAGSSSSE